MGFVRRIKEAIARRVEAPTVSQFDTQEEAEAYVRSALEGSGSMGNFSTWAQSIGAAFLGGVASGGAAFLADPSAALAPGGLKRLGVAAVAGGLVAVAAFLKQSPLPPKESR